MSLPVIMRPLAEADVVEIVDDLEFVRPGLGKRFVARLRETLEQIEWMPERYAIIWNDVRAVKLAKFRYILYYVVLTDQVEILAVLHASRDDAEYRSRI